MEQIESRPARVVALSVDPPETSAKWAAEKGFTFTMVSDPDMNVIASYDLTNTDAGLAYHAVFILDADLRVTYRKIGRRRVRPTEILHALDGDAVECCAGKCGDAPPCRPLQD